jgi:FlaA1/EpsC-like NDP-sugar epimerase
MYLINQFRRIERNYKIAFLFFLDIFIVLLSSILAEYISLGYVSAISKSLLLYTIIITPITITYIYFFKIYRVLNRYLGLDFVEKILLIAALSSATIFFVKYIYNFRNLNINFIILQNFLFFLLILLSRFLIKKIYFYKDSFEKNKEKKECCVIFGAGAVGVNLYRNLKNNNKYFIIAFIDEDPNKISLYIDNLKIVSASTFFINYKKWNVKKCFICTPSASSFKIKQIEKFSLERNIKVIKILSEDSNKISIPLELNNQNKISSEKFIDQNKFLNKNIIVTGAAGSIGQEICFQLQNLKVNKIYCVDSSEYNLSVLKKRAENLNIKNFEYILLDVTKNDFLVNFFERKEIDIIFHAAAYKHVDIVEDNVLYAVYNNLIGLINILELSLLKSIKNFVFISTDKAVNPSNIMGLTKRCGEILVNYYDRKSTNHYQSVRFGNVIGSSGSLLEILKRQLTTGGPLTITDKRATRFFMTISDAVTLVLKSSTLEKKGKIFVLNMGNPINIYTIMKNFLVENNLSEKNFLNRDGDIEIKEIGLRKGEKLHEELFYDQKELICENLIYAENTSLVDEEKIENFLKNLENIIHKKDESELKNYLLAICAS